MTVSGAGSAAHARAVRARARRIRRDQFLHSAGLRTTVRLSAIAVYSICFMWAGFFEWSGRAEALLWAVAAGLWVILLVMFLRAWRTAPKPGSYLLNHLTIPLLLIAPAFMWLAWLPATAFLIVVIAYILELRHHSAGDGFAFSFGLVVFVGIVAGLSMVEIEKANVSSGLSSPPDALFWAFASLLRINYGSPINPTTEDGQQLAVVVSLCAILAASLFTAQIITWVVGKRDDPSGAQRDEGSAELVEQVAALRAEVARLREELGITHGSAAPQPPEVQLRDERSERP